MSSLSYQVLIIRRDGAHINAFESKDFDKSKVKWRELTDQWISVIEESNKPFVLEQPLVVAFDPGLISEVLINAVEEEQKDNNPYKQNQDQNGLGKSLQNFTSGMSGMKDEGYR